MRRQAGRSSSPPGLPLVHLAPPFWAEFRVLRQPWFPAELQVQRADALVWAPAAFRKHGVYLSARDLEAA